MVHSSQIRLSKVHPGLADQVLILQQAFTLAYTYRRVSESEQGYAHITFQGYAPPWGIITYRRDMSGAPNGEVSWSGYADLHNKLIDLIVNVAGDRAQVA